MSFLDSVVDFGKKTYDFVTGDSVGGSLARTALLGFANNKINKMINKESDSRQAQRDPGVRVQVRPDVNHNVPVCYGNAFIEGAVTDAQLTADKKNMWFCLTLCEKTGKLLNGTDSEISIEEVYWDGNRLDFKSDGITVGDAFTPEAERLGNYADNIRIYPFIGSNNPQFIKTENTGNTQPAYDLMPGWTSEHTMDELVFVLVKVTYNSADCITGLGELRFRVNNTMYKPGDVLNDYMTNTRYGAGVPSEEIA